MPVTLQTLIASPVIAGEAIPNRPSEHHPVTGLWINGASGQDAGVITGWGGIRQALAPAELQGSYTQNLYVHQNSVQYCHLGLRVHGYGLDLYVPSASDLAYLNLVKFIAPDFEIATPVQIFANHVSEAFWEQDAIVSATINWDFRPETQAQLGGPILGVYVNSLKLVKTFVDLFNPSDLEANVEFWAWNELGLFDGYVF